MSLPPEPEWLADFDAEPYRLWVVGFTGAMNDGGEWQLPSNNQVYRFDKTKRTLTLVRGPVDSLFWKNKKVFAMVGYTVEVPDVRVGLGKSTVVGSILKDMLEKDGHGL